MFVNHRIVVWQFEKNGRSICKNDPCDDLAPDHRQESYVICPCPVECPNRCRSLARTMIRITGLMFRAIRVVKIFTSLSLTATMQNLASSICAFSTPLYLRHCRRPVLRPAVFNPRLCGRHWMHGIPGTLRYQHPQTLRSQRMSQYNRHY